MGEKAKGLRFREGPLTAVQGSGHETMLPREAAKVHDLHLGAVQRTRSIRGCPELASGRRTSLRLGIDAVAPATCRNVPNHVGLQPSANSRSRRAPDSAHRCCLEPIRRTLPVGRDLLSATADGHSPNPQRSAKAVSEETTFRAFTQDRFAAFNPLWSPGEETISRTDLGLPTESDSNFSNDPCNRRPRLWTIRAEGVRAIRSTRALGYRTFDWLCTSQRSPAAPNSPR